MLSCLFITCWERSDLLAFLCVVFFCVFVTFPYVSGFTSEQMVRLSPLNMFKFSSNFTDRFKAVLLLWIFFDYLCFMIVFVIVYCLFLAAAL